VALVIEDDTSTRQLVCQMLQKDGWTVMEAENGRVGLERVAARCPDLILLDLMMPGMDGFDFLDELREREWCRSVPVVVITAKELTEEDRRRLSGKVVRILEKGAFPRDALLREVSDVVAARVRGRSEPGGNGEHAGPAGQSEAGPEGKGKHGA
jgi:CheY-like chemotaxis protein